MAVKKVESKSLYPKEVKQLLKESKLTLDTEMTERYFEDVYSSVDGEFVVVLDNGRGRKYESRQDFLAALQELEAERRRNKVIYIKSKKRIQQIIEEPGWKYLDKDQDTLGYYAPSIKAIYTHEDGRFFVLLLYQDYGMMFLSGRRPPKPGQPINILEDVDFKGETFINSISVLIQKFATLLKISLLKLDRSLASLELVDQAIRRKGKHNCLETEIFPSLTAYFGEVIRQQQMVGGRCAQLLNMENLSMNLGLLLPMATV